MLIIRFEDQDDIQHQMLAFDEHMIDPNKAFIADFIKHTGKTTKLNVRYDYIVESDIVKRIHAGLTIKNFEMRLYSISHFNDHFEVLKQQINEWKQENEIS